MKLIVIAWMGLCATAPAAAEDKLTAEQVAKEIDAYVKDKHPEAIQ